MGRRLVQRRAAEEDIAEQVAYLAGERPAVAHRYAIALEDAFERLRTMPDVGVLRSYGSRRLHAVRVWPVAGFRRFLICSERQYKGERPRSNVMLPCQCEKAAKDYYQPNVDYRLIDADPRFSINLLREPEYYAKQATVLATLIDVLGYTVAVFMAIGATFGALNCMYSAVASRQVEIATLRAIGFGSLPVVVSVLLEALALALLGGVAGAALAYVYCDGASLSTLNFNTFSQVAFDFRVTRALVVQGLVWALLIGLVGGLFPAIRAARLPVVTALRVS